VTSIATTRPAVADDARLLAELRYEFRSAILPPEESSTDFITRCEHWMSNRLRGAGGWWAWLAVGDAGAVGTIWLHHIDKLPNPVAECEAIGYITSLFVKPEVRGLGIGSALLRTALAECEAAQCDSVVLWPTPQSRTLYARHGFTSREDVFVLKL
jgi:GNAT superfamily N-acetyltransferase